MTQNHRLTTNRLFAIFQFSITPRFGLRDRGLDSSFILTLFLDYHSLNGIYNVWRLLITSSFLSHIVFDVLYFFHLLVAYEWILLFCSYYLSQIMRGVPVHIFHNYLIELWLLVVALLGSSRQCFFFSHGWTMKSSLNCLLFFLQYRLMTALIVGYGFLCAYWSKFVGHQSRNRYSI